MDKYSSFQYLVRFILNSNVPLKDKCFTKKYKSRTLLLLIPLTKSLLTNLKIIIKCNKEIYFPMKPFNVLLQCFTFSITY